MTQKIEKVPQKSRKKTIWRLLSINYQKLVSASFPNRPELQSNKSLIFVRSKYKLRLPSLLTRTGDDRSTVTASQTCRTLTLTVLVQISAIVTIWRVNAVFCNTNYIINKFPTNALKHSSTEIHF